MAPELRRLRSWRSHSISNLNEGRERDAFQDRRMNLRSRKGDTKDMTTTNVSEGSDDQENVGPQLRSGRKIVVSVCANCVLLSFVGVSCWVLCIEEIEEDMLCRIMGHRCALNFKIRIPFWTRNRVQ